LKEDNLKTLAIYRIMIITTIISDSSTCKTIDYINKGDLEYLLLLLIFVLKSRLEKYFS
jgi:hypothetical protein